jgi:hypothetical protein
MFPSLLIYSYPPMTYRIIYPDVRDVSEKQVRSWLADAIANGQTDNRFGDNINPDTVDMDIALQMLNDTGLITFSCPAFRT